VKPGVRWVTAVALLWTVVACASVLVYAYLIPTMGLRVVDSSFLREALGLGLTIGSACSVAAASIGVALRRGARCSRRACRLAMLSGPLAVWVIILVALLRRSSGVEYLQSLPQVTAIALGIALLLPPLVSAVAIGLDKRVVPERLVPSDGV
jgi:hypothetical protein